MKCIFSLLFLLSILSVRAQESKDYKKYKEDYNFSVGYIIDLQGNRQDGLIKKNEDKFYKKIVFVSPHTDKKVFHPGRLLEYGLPSRRFISAGMFFLEVIQDGKIGLYRKDYWNYNTYKYSHSGNRSIFINRNDPLRHQDAKEIIKYYLRKRGSNKFIRISKETGFKGESLDLISDCENLVNYRKNNHISIHDIEEIVRQYNMLCD